MTAQYRDDDRHGPILAARIRALLELPRTGQTETSHSIGVRVKIWHGIILNANYFIAE